MYTARQVVFSYVHNLKDVTMETC